MDKFFAARASIRAGLLFLSLGFFSLTAPAFADDETNLVWGVNALTLPPPCPPAPSLTDLLTNQASTISLSHFYRAGGANVAATPTECRLAWNSNELMVVYRCQEKNPAWPVAHHPADWYALLSSPSDQDSAFPDKVDCFLQPDPRADVYYEFSATLDGLKFGVKCQPRPLRKAAAEDAEDDAVSPAGKISDFQATVVTNAGEWIVFLQIPWRTVGGRPRHGFGFIPIRSRWRDGEVSSPVAMGFNDRPPPDLFIETQFPGGPPVNVAPASLCQLPSDTLRWQRPAWLSYPSPATLRDIWGLQQSLNEPTGTNNLARRLYLLQRWMDLLTLEGFNFSPGSGSIVKQSMKPVAIRHRINTDLQKGHILQACLTLDDWLHRLDSVSRQWFADGTPGDISDDAWTPVSELKSAEVKSRVLLLHCAGAGQLATLELSLPQTGGLRIHGPAEGYFKPDELLPLKLTQFADAYSVRTPEGRVMITRAPFAISFYDLSGKMVTQIGPGDLAFRFGAGGRILAVDFKNHLDPDEVIYGFGEKYDHFNEHGNVLTLWGMDDWEGNTVGLMNQSYKPIPLLHSSRGYTLFDNSSYRLRADIGKTDPNQYRLTQAGPVFDYYIWLDNPENALQSYTSLTGKPILPPRWAFEPWMGRTGRGWNAGPLHNQVAEEERVVQRFAELDIPHSAIYSEGKGADSAALNHFMAARGIKVLSWYFPSIDRPTQAKLMPELTASELPVLKVGDQLPANDPDYVDFSNPQALELSRRWWKHRLDVGVAGSMIDFGDRVPESAVFYDGRRGDEMHNAYSYDYHRTYSEVFREKRGDDFIVFGRAAAPGTQKWAAQFGGDHAANFTGLRGVLTGALNLSACGFSTWGSDLGGFLGWPEPLVYIRWTQFACFSPLMRCHGRTPREPWNFGTAAVANYKFYTWLREDLLDYVYDNAIVAHETGRPMMRSLAVAFPDEPALSAVGDEYMFGSDLLVAPVTSDDNTRTIQFPGGNWTSLWNGTTIQGPAAQQIVVPWDRIPVYLKPGAVMRVRLDPAWQLGQSLTKGFINAFLVTPPAGDEDITLPSGDGEVTGRLHPVSGGFLLILKNGAPDTGVVVYGMRATTVKVNGAPLPELAGGGQDSLASGWWNDPAIRRVVIHPPGKNLSREIQIELISKP
jgi:alpha-glucosidase (family GH31 glycosyl hydrolase)